MRRVASGWTKSLEAALAIGWAYPEHHHRKLVILRLAILRYEGQRLVACEFRGRAGAEALAALRRWPFCGRRVRWEVWADREDAGAPALAAAA